MSKSTKVFIISIVSVFVGFTLGVGYDQWKSSLESKQREQIALTLFREELIVNRAIAKDNREALKIELDGLNKKEENKQIYVLPFRFHQNAVWNTLIVYFPKKFSKNSKILLKLRSLGQEINYTNQLLESREEYRLNNSGHAEYTERLEIYDKEVLKFEELLLKEFDKIEPMLY